MLADAIDADQSALFECGFQLFLAGFVFCVSELATEWVPGSDIGRA
jgi:hypothetical protein